MVILFPVPGGIAILLPTVAAPVGSPTSSARGLAPFAAHSPARVSVASLTVAPLPGVQCHLVVGLACLALLIGAVGPFFLGLLAACMSSLEKYLFTSSAHVFDWVVMFL